MSIGKNIKQARKKAGLTQKELGDKLGVSQAAIGQFEKENSNPKLETLHRIAAALRVNIEQLVDNFSELPEIKRAIDSSDLDILIDFLNDKIIDIPTEQKKEITEHAKNDSISCENKEQFFELTVKYSHHILNCIMERYAEWDISDIVLLLSYYLAANGKGQEKISDYAIDIYGNPEYRKDVTPEDA